MTKTFIRSDNGWLTSVFEWTAAEFGWQPDLIIWHVPLATMLLAMRQKLFTEHPNMMTLAMKEWIRANGK